MKIRKMTADFGTLRGESLSLSEGLNVITAPNERGKSTWCAFLKAMLYGVDSAQRAKAGVLPDKKRYAAWDSGAMSGEMELCWQGREITLSRGGKASAPMKDFAAVSTGTGLAVPELTGVGAGETLTGVPRAVFENSAFIGQSAMRVTQGPELEKRIASIVSSGEEDVSFSETEKKLLAWQRRRRYRTGGELPALEAEMEEKTSALDALSRADGEIGALTDEVERRRERCEALRAEMTESRHRTRQAMLSRSSEGRNALHLAQQQAAEAAAREALSAEKLAGSAFGSETPETVRETVRETALRSRALNEKAQAETKSRAALLLAILGILAAVAGIILIIMDVPLSHILLGAALLLIAASGLCLRKQQRARAAAQQAAEERRTLLLQFGVPDEEALCALADTHTALYESWQQAAAESRAAEEKRLASEEKQKTLDAQVLSALDFSGGDSEAARLGRALQEEEALLQRSREALATAKGRLGVLGDPLVLRSELEALREKHARVQAEYDAISVTLDVLRSADAEIRTRFSPQLGARAAELFSRLTDGRYDRLTLDETLSAQARRQGDTLAHDALYLSGGAYDQLYLALRLAICELALPEGECPIVLDDALCSFDDERCALALGVLREIAEKRQVLLFTCHGREAEMLKDAPDVRCIRL